MSAEVPGSIPGGRTEAPVVKWYDISLPWTFFVRQHSFGCSFHFSPDVTRLTRQPETSRVTAVHINSNVKVALQRLLIPLKLSFKSPASLRVELLFSLTRSYCTK